MLSLNCKVVVGNITLAYINNVTIESSTKELSQTCVIHLPKSTKLQDTDLLNLIGRGDTVEVWLGYNTDLRKEFEGYVTKVEPSVPFVIHCENSAYLLKQATVSQSWRNPHLSEIIAAITTTPAVVEEMQFGAFRINQTSPYKVIEGLREKFGIQSFFKNSVLHVGTVPPPQTAKYDFQQNIVSHNLTWKTKDEFNFGVKAVSVLPNNEIHEYTAGSNSGNTKTVTYYNLSEAELKRRASTLLQQQSYDGYDGEITTFGLPYIQHADIAELRDNEYPTRSGSYQIEKTTVSFGQSGFRRTLKLGQRIV